MKMEMKTELQLQHSDWCEKHERFKEELFPHEEPMCEECLEEAEERPLPSKATHD
ncbi:MAG: hypothetical protein HY538_02500 [Deltaproteobacteria bacterium]|nr:hypothetical protein [Deltaproteobacteria bacterium]